MRKTYREIARRHGVTVAEVRAQMQAAIDEAWKNPEKMPEIIAAQREVPCKGSIPTPEELIRYGKRKILSGK